MKIGVVSDTHDNIVAIQAAVALLRHRGVELWRPGIRGYGGILP